jgi:hypothetical protein
LQSSHHSELSIASPMLLEVEQPKSLLLTYQYLVLFLN